MAKQNYYDILEISKDCDDGEIKSAFRTLAKQHHPDRNPGNDQAEHKFKEINEAYEVLKDPQKRAAYDQFGHAAFEGGGSGAHGFGGDFSSSMSDIFDDLFGEFMGGRSRSRSRGVGERGSDLRYNMTISLDEAYQGKAAKVDVPTSITCESCSGSGAKPGTKPAICPTCSGGGKVRASQGFFTIERTCSTCSGYGQIIESPCAECRGTGRVSHERTLSINIPAGVEEGTRIRLAGEGEAGVRGGSHGDLYIFISLTAHEFFQRDGGDIFCRVPISMTTAALGSQIEVPTVSGTAARVRIPEGSESGKQFRLKSMGMPILRSRQKGDMYVQIEVETPQNLTRKQKNILREFEKEATDKTHPQSAGFFSKAKEFFEGIGD